MSLETMQIFDMTLHGAAYTVSAISVLVFFFLSCLLVVVLAVIAFESVFALFLRAYRFMLRHSQMGNV